MRLPFAIRRGWSVVPASPLLLLALGCASPETPARGAAQGTALPPSMTGAPLPAGFAVEPRAFDEATARLCGVIATRTKAPAVLPGMAAGDSTRPRVAQRGLEGPGLVGVRFLVPGTDAAYVFEGVTKDGRQRVRVRRPVRADSSVRIPVGAPDALIEASLTPSPPSLDQEIMLFAPPLFRGTAAAPGDPKAAPVLAQAVAVRTDLPFFDVQVSEACPDVTLLLGMVARADKLLKIPVKRGDRIAAHAVALAGVARVSFDEAGPAPAVPRLTPVPQAEVVADADGKVTLRVALFVADKAQAAGQDVLVHVSWRRSP